LYENTSEDESAAATAPLIDATSVQRDAIAVMTALRGYGSLNFSTACEVLIRDFSDIYLEWAKLAKIASVILVSSVERLLSAESHQNCTAKSPGGEESHTTDAHFKLIHSSHFTHAEMCKK